ncbi:MAG: hypothetical protein WB676_28615 [Bryobacteraceae bacterium]
MQRSSFPWFAWWYLAISLGFVLLAVSRVIAGEKAWLVGIRLLIAAGFGVLSAFEFRRGDRRR